MNNVLLNNKSIIGKCGTALENVDDTHKLLKDVKVAFEAMQQKAQKDMVDIQICSSYRNFEKQLSIWNRKWSGELPLYSSDGRIVEANSLSNIEKIHAIMFLVRAAWR